MVFFLEFLAFDCVPSFSSGRGFSSRRREGSVKGRDASEPEGNLDGFLARLHGLLQNEGKEEMKDRTRTTKLQLGGCEVYEL
jgi:hypothetical protein